MEARPDRPAFAAIVSEPLSFAARSPKGAFTAAVTRAPAGSSATWTGNTITCDLPGRYRLIVKNGTDPAFAAEVVAFPPEALTYGPVADTNHRYRMHRNRDGYGVGYNESNGMLADHRSPLECYLVLVQIASGGLGPLTDDQFDELTAEHPVPEGLHLHSAHREPG
jgi:hypothetical protein